MKVQKKEIQLSCGCYYQRNHKGKMTWTLCQKAKELKNDYQKDFKNRKFYDEHFFNVEY